VFVTGPSAPYLTQPQVVVGLLGGLALFLLGMAQLTESLKAFASDGRKRLLKRLTKNRVLGAATGASVAALLQSSSATTVLIVGFLSAGLLSLEQSIGVIMGANVGTTITAQFIAFDVARHALLLMAGGFAFSRLSPKGPSRRLGVAIAAIGLVFFGMSLMSRSAGTLRNHEGFLDLMASAQEPLLAILIATIFTALVQSSTATVGVVIVLAGQGFVTLETSIALLFGANVGTCVTAGLAAVGKPRPALQAALAHVLFNVAGVVIWLPCIRPLADLVRQWSPTASEHLSASEQIAAELPRQVANAHVLFNLGTLLVLLMFATSLAELVRRIAPDKRE